MIADFLAFKKTTTLGVDCTTATCGIAIYVQEHEGKLFKKAFCISSVKKEHPRYYFITSSFTH